MSLARTGIRGAALTSLALGLRQIISLLTTFYVARQLLPTDIGLFSMVMVVIGFAQVIGDVGIATGLVRSQKNTPTVLSTCFWVGAGIGTVLTVGVFLLAPLAAAFYGKLEIEPFLRASALGLLINFMTPVPMALLQQRLAYKEIAISQSLGSFIGAVAAITLVYSGVGIWGLVCQPIVGNVIIWLCLVYFAKWLPTLQFQLSSAQDILQTGMHLLGSGLTGYLRSNFDALVIGKALPAQALGLYGMAQTILYAPMHLITSTVSRVIFPLLAKVQNDLEKVKELVLTATSRTTFLVFPIYFGLIILADKFVIQVFGANWTSMIPLIKIMVLPFIIQSISTFSAPLMLALGKSKILMLMSFGAAIFYFIVLLLLIPYGLTSVAIGYAITNSIIGVASLALALHYAKISVRDYVLSISRPLMMTLFMSLVILVLKAVVPLTATLQLICLIVAGVATYALLLFFFEKPVWQQVLNALRDQAQRRPS